MKIAYYYQSFVGLQQLATHYQDVDRLIVSSLHFDDDPHGAPGIYLNDNEPNDVIFYQMWTEVEKASAEGVDVHLMVGGAGGAFQALFSDFEGYYPLLSDLLRDKSFITGINLDIEETVALPDVKRLIQRLSDDFSDSNDSNSNGSDRGFQVTMAPVQGAMTSDSSGMGGFSYKELFGSPEGQLISSFNVQCYGAFSYDTFKAIVDNGYPSHKICLGIMSGQYTSETFHEFVSEVQQINRAFPEFAGVYDWEYLNAPPDTKDPSVFASILKNIIK